MEDVTWSEFILGGLGGIVLLLVPSGVIFAFLSTFLGISSVYEVSTFNLALIGTGLVGSLLAARAYRGPDNLLEHGWLLAAVLIAIPVVFFVLSYLGTISTGTAAEYASWLCTTMAALFFEFVFILYVHSGGFLAASSSEKGSPANVQDRNENQ